MAQTTTDTRIDASTSAAKLGDGVVKIEAAPAQTHPGFRVFVHYNGPTDMLSGMCTGMAVLEPGVSPHPPHRHAEEEILIVAGGTGEIECDGKTVTVGAGDVMYCAGNVLHGITNTGLVPMTFYWSKWLAR